MPKVESYKAKADRIRAYAIDSGFSSLLAGLLVEKFFLKHQDGILILFPITAMWLALSMGWRFHRDLKKLVSSIPLA
jgi:hypothetical protein